MTDTMSVIMPDGTQIDGIPVGTPKAAILAKWQVMHSPHPAGPLQNYVAGQVGAPSTPPQQQESPGFLGTAWDMARSVPGGLAQGVAGIAGLPGDIDNLGRNGVRWLAQKSADAVGLGDQMRALDASSEAHRPHTSILPTSGDVNSALSAPTGGYYQPKTGAGDFAQTAASFLPAAFGGGGSIASKLVGRVLAPAAGSELAGAATQGTPYEPYARAAGALAGGLALPRLARLGTDAGAKLMAPRLTADELALQHVRKVAQGSGITPGMLTQPDVASLASRGLTGAEALGPTGINALKVIGRQPGLTAGPLREMLQARSEGAPTRMLGDYTTAAGIDPAAAQGNFDDLLKAGQGAASPLYAKAYSLNQNVASPAIDRILATPAGRKAMRQASDLMQNDQSLMGVRDPDLLEQAREGGTEIPWKGGVASGLKLRSLDYVKRALDDQIGTAFRAGNRTEGGILTGLKSRLVDALDEADVSTSTGPNSTRPEGGYYLQARRAAGDYLGAKDAFESGADSILNPAVSAKQFQAMISDLPVPHQTAFKGGIANKLFNMQQNGTLRPKFINAPAVQQKLAAALGQANALNFVKAMKAEQGLSATGGSMMPLTNSPTFDMLSAAENQGTTSDLLRTGADIGSAAIHAKTGNVIGLLGSGARLFSRANAARQTIGLTPAARDAAGRLFMLPPSDLASAMNVPPPTVASRLPVPGLKDLLLQAQVAQSATPYKGMFGGGP